MNNRKVTKMVENYSLDEVIGQGQYGKVYRATNVKTNKVVAIKVVKIQKFKENPKLEECTVNEIKTLSQMDDNRHVVQFIELLRSSNNYYFVYEFCSGGTLEDQLKKKKIFKENEALIVFSQLIEAFKILRRFNIMHRDLKPTNILLHNNAIKLADFGFCKSLTNPTDMAQTMLGSPLYMAPEILRGQDYCVKADIWSLGVVLYELLFGICPFEEKSIVRLINLLNDGTLVIRKDIQTISPQTEALLMAMLVKDPDQRISWEQLFQIQINSEGEYVDPTASIKGGASSSKKERSLQPKPPHTTPQSFQNTAPSTEEVQKQAAVSGLQIQSSSPISQVSQQYQQTQQQQGSSQKHQTLYHPPHQNSHHQRSASSHVMFPQQPSKTDTPSKKAPVSGGMLRDQSFDKLDQNSTSQNNDKRYSEHREKNTQQYPQGNDNSNNNISSNEALRTNSSNNNILVVPHPPQRENPYRATANEEKSPLGNTNVQGFVESPLAPQRLQMGVSNEQMAAQPAVIRESYNTSSSNLKFQRQDHKRAFTAVGGVNNYQKPLSINNNIMNIQQNDHRENNLDILNTNTTTGNACASASTNVSANMFSHSDSKRNNIHYQTLEERYKSPLLQSNKAQALQFTPTQAPILQAYSQQKEAQVSQDQISNGQSSSTSGRSNSSNNNITQSNQSSFNTSSTNNLAVPTVSSINQNTNASSNLNNITTSTSSSKITSNNQLNISGNNQALMYSSSGTQVPPIHPSVAQTGVCKNNKQPATADVSTKIISELSKERNKLFFLTQLLYELIDICENENYNIILPQITFQYYQQIILVKCERMKKLLELNQTQITQQLDLQTPITTMDLARTMMNEGYIKLRSAIEKEITLIEQNFLHVKNEYLYFEIYFQQNNNTEQFQQMKTQSIESIIKSFIKQVIANNETDEGGETQYVNRLKVCAKLVDIYDFDQILMHETGNNINNWVYSKDIKSSDKQKILSKIFNHQSLSPIS